MARAPQTEEELNAWNEAALRAGARVSSPPAPPPVSAPTDEPPPPGAFDVPRADEAKRAQAAIDAAKRRMAGGRGSYAPVDTSTLDTPAWWQGPLPGLVDDPAHRLKTRSGDFGAKPGPGAPAPEGELSGQDLKAGAQIAGVAKPADAPPEGAPGEGGDPGAPVGAASTGGAPATVIPGGMYPDKMQTSVKLGKPVPEEAKRAFGASASAELGGAESAQHAAEKYYTGLRDIQQAHLAAIDDARAQHAEVQAKRDAMVNQRLGEIEALNKEAQGNPEDIWGDKQLYATFLSTALRMLGMFGALTGSVGAFSAGSVGANAMDGLINQDIQAKLQARKAAGEAARAKTDLLGMYLDKYKDEDKAIDATRLAYYDHALMQMEALKAQHGADISDAQYKAAVGGILEKRGNVVRSIAAQEANDVQQQFDQKYHMPQVVGGAGAGGSKNIPHLVTLSNKTTYEFPNEPTQNKAIEKIQFYTILQNRNKEILKLRQEAAKLSVNPIGKDFPRYKEVMAQLNELGEDKAKLLEQAREQGVLRDQEYKRAMEYNVGATDGIGYTKDVNPWSAAQRNAVDSMLRRQTQRWDEDQVVIARGAGARLVDRGYKRDPTSGELYPYERYRGQDVQQRPALPPTGTRAMDPRVHVPTAAPGDKDTTPPAPNYGTAPRKAPASSSHHRKKKKDDDG